MFTEKVIHYQKAVHHLHQSISPSSLSWLSWLVCGCLFCPPLLEPHKNSPGCCRTNRQRKERKWLGCVVCCNRRMFQHSRQTPREFSPTDPGEQIFFWKNHVIIIDHIIDNIIDYIIDHIIARTEDLLGSPDLRWRSETFTIFFYFDWNIKQHWSLLISNTRFGRLPHISERIFLNVINFLLNILLKVHSCFYRFLIITARQSEKVIFNVILIPGVCHHSRRRCRRPLHLYSSCSRW